MTPDRPADTPPELFNAQRLVPTAQPGAQDAGAASETHMTDPVAATAVAAPPARFNFAKHLLDCNASRPGKLAFVDDLGGLSYGALDDRVRRMATGLRALGLRREERVLLLMQDCTDWPVAFLGAIYAGLVPVAVNTLLTADDYAYMLAHCRAQAVLVSGALLPALAAAMTRCDHEVSRIIVSRPQAPLHGAPLQGAPIHGAPLQDTPIHGAPSEASPLQPAEIELETFLHAHAPAAPRARCTRTPTPNGRPSCTASGC